MSIRNIAVIGAGTMGSGIVQACATSGFPVVMIDVAQAALDRGLQTIGTSLDRMVNRQKLGESERQAALGRIRVSTTQDPIRECNLVIEAATENPELKLRIFRQLDELADPTAIIASNTSSISITRLAAATNRPAQVVGMHFFNPVPVMALVEIIAGLQTSDETRIAVAEVATRLGKVVVNVRNSPGFVVNRLLCPMLNEACFALGEGLATAKDIDEAMKLGCNHPIGPLALCDMVGLDVVLAVMDVLYDSFKDSKYRPAPLLLEMVEAGHLGRKSGRGFYTYS